MSAPRVQVVVVDDDDPLRTELVEVLETAGYRVAGLASAAETLARFDELQPDLIVLDMMMPGMDGFEFLSRVRAHPAGARVPVLIHSVLGGTLARSIDAASARELGVAGVVPKSGDIESLLEHVRRIMDRGVSSETTACRPNG